ncbi:acetylornithine carbamoyltransferase [Tenacibaculum sp. E3R01]|uniref:acetylornithine carbamoyltransferase n=1 Tax=unclassified Tenacibaculum TaxID=2635139 RepID=UPI000897CA78|nr:MULTISPECIES: acetylornithine carbamoyltransferase [unclassified Tenacibaculum]RBW62339.1 acetylornithine carbamoyltransferase [Tenacibaculum sp. E3R01]SEE30374.1 N-succinyl-L-ornithine transcarbamylase [Tenacibaculum sp. MAR_2010_89]
MKKYTSLNDINNLQETINKAILLKKDPFKFSSIGKNKTLVMLFFNASLRTRLSTEKAAKNLGMHVSVLNISNAWNLEFEDGTVMNLTSSEHIKEAAKVISQYAEIIAIRAFPSLKNKEKDASEFVINNFIKYAEVPIVNMESATDHPLQALADAITITEFKTVKKPKVVLSWAPHPKALPHSVANAFVHLMHKMEVDFTITHPKGYELDTSITKDTLIEHDQHKAFENADFIYTKNWSSYLDYGKTTNKFSNWMITKKNLGNAKFMHCLPIRRNVVAEDEVLDSDNSLVIKQANNRTYATQIVLKQILENL